MQCRAAGEITGASTGGHGYNVLNGKSFDAKKRLVADSEHAGADVSASSTGTTAPAATLESVSYDDRIMSGGLNQYKNAAEALKPIGNYPATSLVSGPPSSGDSMSSSKEFSSHRLYKQELRKHTRPVLGPKDKTTKPVTSSQVREAAAVEAAVAAAAAGPSHTRKHHHHLRIVDRPSFAEGLRESHQIVF